MTVWSTLTVADVAPYLDELDAAGEAEIEIGFTGGEPFMAPEMLDILRLVLERGHSVLMLTNAMQPMMRPRVKGGLMALRETYRRSAHHACQPRSFLSRIA